MHFVILWVRKFHLAVLAAGFAAQYLVLLAFSGESRVPGRPPEVVSSAAPFVSILFCILVPYCFGDAHGELEAIFARRAEVRRIWLLGVLTVVCLAPVGPAFDRTFRYGAGVRNSLLLAGLGLLGMRFVSPGISWSPIAILVGTTWLIGTPPAGQAVPPWAVLLHPPTSVISWTVTVGCFGIGASSFVARNRFSG